MFTEVERVGDGVVRLYNPVNLNRDHDFNEIKACSRFTQKCLTPRH